MNELFELERVLKGKRKGGIIEDWRIVSMGEPIVGTGEIVFGRILNDEEFGHTDSQNFHTSEVVRHYVVENIVETRNSYYALGRPFVPPTLNTDLQV